MNSTPAIPKPAMAAVLIMGGALAWALLLWLAGAFTLPFPLTLFEEVLAAGLPAFFIAPLAYRARLWQPVVWAVVAYCLGHGVWTSLTMGAGQPGSRYVEVALAHAATATVLVPVDPAGYLPMFGNLLWLVIVVLCATYGLEGYRGGAPKAKGGPDATTGKE